MKKKSYIYILLAAYAATFLRVFLNNNKLSLFMKLNATKIPKKKMI